MKSWRLPRVVEVVLDDAVEEDVAGGGRFPVGEVSRRSSGTEDAVSRSRADDVFPGDHVEHDLSDAVHLRDRLLTRLLPGPSVERLEHRRPCQASPSKARLN